jgi:hypothetical protein
MHHHHGMNRYLHALLLILLMGTSPETVMADAMALPGSSWTLDLPEGFSVRQNLVPTFINRTGWIISVVDGPPQSLKGLPLPKLGDVSNPGTDNETKLEAIDELQIDGHAALLLRLRIEKQKKTVFTLLVEGKGSNANVTTWMSDLQLQMMSEQELRAMLMTLREKNLTEQERLAALSFEVKDRSGFTLAGVVGTSIAVFTDGPEKNIEKAPKQATVSVILSPTGQTDITPEMLAIFDQQGMLEGFLKHQLPNAVLGAHKPILAAEIPAIEIPYARSLTDGAVNLAGVVRFMGADKQLLMVYSSYPEGDAAKAAATLKLVESVRMKAAAQ